MQPLNLPHIEAKIMRRGEKPYIFDPIRRRYISLTPEEWVRQHFVSFLINHRHVPAALVGNEVSLTVAGQNRRCDTVICNRQGQPVAIVEYKAPDVAITQKVFDQITRYNMALHVGWLIVSNGLRHICCHIDYAPLGYQFVPDIPDWDILSRESSVSTATDTGERK